ncbi:MAG TPA: CheR family methyltransferase [Blastocatellia bacterium]|jgi:chemotaxis protein methyltransferase CheR
MSDNVTNDNLEELEIDLLLEAVFRYYGYDLRDYDRGAVRLRIRERMLAGRIPTISRFQEKVLREPALLERLLGAFSLRDLSMFSDPAFYNTFRTKVVPQLRTYPFVRIWHAGCSTGEDVYSMAILLKEEGLYERSRIYATDMSTRAIGQARVGSFSLSLPDKCAANYRSSGGKWSLSQYFSKKGKRALIDPALKKNIVFSEHNLATDGSFNEFQVVVCRGILGSFNQRLKERVDKLIYESLSRFGVLALGPAESIESMPHEDCYAPLDTESCLYQKRGMPGAAASNW